MNVSRRGMSGETPQVTASQAVVTKKKEMFDGFTVLGLYQAFRRNNEKAVKRRNRETFTPLYMGPKNVSRLPKSIEHFASRETFCPLCLILRHEMFHGSLFLLKSVKHIFACG